MNCPIFILGIAQRSGTNYLHDLVALHPDCATRNPPTLEDYLLRDAEHLLAYARSLAPFWSAHWQFHDQEPAILAALGRGLMSFIAAAAPGKRVITKTPCVENLEHFPKLFPDVPLLILVRDGRAVAESAFRSFQRPYEHSTRMWAYGAKLIRAFQEAHVGPGGAKHLVIRYEDLVQNVRGEMRKVLELLDLDTEVYDFDAAENLPVRGSSVHRGESKKLHWEPVQKTENFRPLQRFANWSKVQHNRFNWIAGKEMSYFGYTLEPDCCGWVHSFINRAYDARHKFYLVSRDAWGRLTSRARLLHSAS